MKLGILLTGSPIHTIFLKSCFEQIKNFDIPIVMGWDDIVYSEYVSIPSNVSLFVNGDIYGKLPGVKLQMITGFNKLIELGCTHCFLFGADTGLFNPSGIKEVEKYLDKYDFISPILPTNNYYFDAFVGRIDYFLDSIMNSINADEVNLTAYMRRKNYSHLVVPVDKIMGFRHFQYEFLSSVRSDTSISKKAYEICRIIEEEDEVLVLEKILRPDIIEISVKYGCVFGNVRLVGYTINSDFKSITPIMDFFDLDCKISVGDWFNRCVKREVDWVRRCPVRVFL